MKTPPGLSSLGCVSLAIAGKSRHTGVLHPPRVCSSESPLQGGPAISFNAGQTMMSDSQAYPNIRFRGHHSVHRALDIECKLSGMQSTCLSYLCQSQRRMTLFREPSHERPSHALERFISKRRTIPVPTTLTTPTCHFWSKLFVFLTHLLNKDARILCIVSTELRAR